MLFDFDDILIEPALHSNIKLSTEINCLDCEGMLPLFSAPMNVNIKFNEFYSNKMHSILTISEARNNNIDVLSSNRWFSYDIQDFQSIFIDNHMIIDNHAKIYALINIENAHIIELKDVIEKAKKQYGESIVLMVGNVLSPMTFLSLAQSGVDFIQIGLGDINLEHITDQTGIGYPMASLIRECYIIQQDRNLKTMIIADGDTGKFVDIIKSLALGADYVMVRDSFDPFCSAKIKNNISSFTKILKTAMKYTDCLTIGEFIGKTRFNLITKNAAKRLTK